MAACVIDSYCEVILANDQFCASESESDEIKQEFLADLQAKLIRFADETEYTQDDLKSGKALLQILKKTFGAKEFLKNIKLGKQVQQYYDVTMEMLDTAIAQHPDFSAEKVFTIVSNLLLITNNVQACRSGKKSFRRKNNDEVVFVTSEMRYDVAFSYLDSILKIKAKGVKAEKRINRVNKRNEKTIQFRMKRFTKIFVTVILAAVALGLLATYVIGLNDITTKQMRPETSDIFNTIGDWFYYDILGNEIPTVMEEGLLKKAAPFTLIGFIVSVIALILLWLAKPLCDKLLVKNKEIQTNLDQQAKRSWYEFQYLHKVLMATNMRLNELED